MIDDPDVRLVWDVDVDVVDGDAAALHDVLGRLHEDAGCELEDLTSVHLDVPLGVGEDPGAAAGQPEVLAARPVGPELEAEEALLGGRLEHDGARSVAEQDERRAVVPVEDAREEVAADDERLLREA